MADELESLGLLAQRRAGYLSVLERLGVDGAILTSDAAVGHATGAVLYTSALLPERPIVAVIGASATRLVACDYEIAQLATDIPGLAVDSFPEFGVDPWAVVAETARHAIGRNARVVVESTCPWLAMVALQRGGLSVRIDDGFDGLLMARMRKDLTEIGRYSALSHLCDASIAAVSTSATSAWTEQQVASAIFADIAKGLDGPVEGAGIAAGAEHNMSMHHLSSRSALGGPPIRLGVKIRSDGYWLLLTRMAAVAGHRNVRLQDDVSRYLDVYRAGMESLRVGATGRSIYEAIRRMLTRHGLELASMKVGHGTGFGFREPPILSADGSVPLEAGMVLAYDFAVNPASTRSGCIIHVEDRILVSNEGPIRLSDVSPVDRPLTLPS